MTARAAPLPALPDRVGTTVVGGGIVGLCLSWFLAEAGDDVLCLDDGRHAGSTANAGSLHVQMQSRFIRLYPDLAPGVEADLPLYVSAVRHWQALAQRLGTDIGIHQTGGLMVAETAEQMAFLDAKCRREAALGLDVRMLDRPALDRLAPYLGPAVIGAEWCGHEGKLNPLLANAAISARARAAGAVLATGCTVRRIEKDHGRYRLDTANGVVQSVRVVVAAGAGSGALLQEIGIPVATRAEPLHMNITEPTEPLVRHLIQHADRPITLKQLGAGQMVIGGGWPAGPAERASPPGVLLPSLLGNIALAQHIVPAIGGLRLLRTWAGVNTSVDGRGVLGAAAPGLFVAIPGDAGYTLGPLCARLVADAMLGRTPEVPLGPYSPARFAR